MRGFVLQAVEIYRKNKGFCDNANHMRANCKIERRSCRKYRNIFMGLAQLLILVNSQLLWADIHDKKTFDSKALRGEWIDSVIRKIQAERSGEKVRKARRKTVKGIEHGLMGRFGMHKLEKWPEKRINSKTGAVRRKQIECYQCRNVHHRRHDTIWYCKLCTDGIGLPDGFCINKRRRCYIKQMNRIAMVMRILIYDRYTMCD